MFARIELRQSRLISTVPYTVSVEGDPLLLAHLARVVEADGTHFFCEQSGLSHVSHRIVGSLVADPKVKKLGEVGRRIDHGALVVFPIYQLFGAMAEYGYQLKTSLAPRVGAAEVHIFYKAGKTK